MESSRNVKNMFFNILCVCVGGGGGGLSTLIHMPIEIYAYIYLKKMSRDLIHI